MVTRRTNPTLYNRAVDDYAERVFADEVYEFSARNITQDTLLASAVAAKKIAVFLWQRTVKTAAVTSYFRNADSSIIKFDRTIYPGDGDNSPPCPPLTRACRVFILGTNEALWADVATTGGTLSVDGGYFLVDA